MQRRILLSALAALPLAIGPAAIAATPPDTIGHRQADRRYHHSRPRRGLRALRRRDRDQRLRPPVALRGRGCLQAGRRRRRELDDQPRRQDLHLQAPAETRSSRTARPLTAEDAAFSLQRVVILDKTPAFLLDQLGWTTDNVKDLVKATGPDTLQFTITDRSRAVAGAQPDDLHRRLGGREEGRAGARGEGRPRQRLAEDATPPAPAPTSWSPGSPTRASSWRPIRNSASAPRQQAGDRAARAGVRLATPAAREGRRRYRPRPLAGPDRARSRGTRTSRPSPSPGSDSWYIGDERRRRAPRANPKVREAMKYLVDYDGMATSFLKGIMFVHQTFLPAGLPRRDRLRPLQARCRQGQGAAGRGRLSRTGSTCGWTRATTRPPRDRPVGAADVGQAGVKVEIVPGDGSRCSAVYRSRKHQTVAGQLGPDYFDPHTNADSFRPQHRQFRQAARVQAAGLAQRLGHPRDQRRDGRRRPRNSTPPSGWRCTRTCRRR